MLNLFKPRSLGARIIAINFIGLILLALGFIYVDKSEDNLIKIAAVDTEKTPTTK